MTALLWFGLLLATLVLTGYTVALRRHDPTHCRVCQQREPRP